MMESGKWIPCSERLPHPGQMVLAIVNGKPCENITLVGAYELAEILDDEWLIEQYPEWENAAVTYWTPLPEPPKEEL